MTLPPNWHTWGISAKAEYLVRVGRVSSLPAEKIESINTQNHYTSEPLTAEKVATLDRARMLNVYKARFANAALALFPNQFVNVRLQLATIDNAVVVPVTALRHSNDGDYVYVLNAAERIRYAPIPALPLELAVLELFPDESAE